MAFMADECSGALRAESRERTPAQRGADPLRGCVRTQARIRPLCAAAYTSPRMPSLEQAAQRPAVKDPARARKANAAAERRYRVVMLATVLGPFAGALVAAALAVRSGVSPLALWLGVALYALTAVGLELGFHRYFSHYAFKAKKPVIFALGVLGSMGMEGPVIFWASNHRRHHKHSDKEGDPHSPHRPGANGVRGLLAGMWHAHIGWTFVPQNVREWIDFAPELFRDDLSFFIHRTYFVWVAVGLALPAAICGLVEGTARAAVDGLLWGGLVRMFLIHHATYSINSICHTFGARDYESRDESRNNAWLALLSLGGSWHNNHHAFPTTARNDLAWWQVDVCGWVVRALAVVGLTWDVKMPAEAARAARRRKG